MQSGVGLLKKGGKKESKLWCRKYRQPKKTFSQKRGWYEGERIGQRKIIEIGRRKCIPGPLRGSEAHINFLGGGKSYEDEGGE